jgi:hypothetical protein
VKKKRTIKIPHIFHHFDGMSLYLFCSTSRSSTPWRIIQPNPHKHQPPDHRPPNTCNPHPPAADRPTAGPLVVREVPDGHGPLLVDVSEEWTFVVDAEGEDAVLIRQDEGDGEDGGVGGVGGGL